MGTSSFEVAQNIPLLQLLVITLEEAEAFESVGSLESAQAWLIKINNDIAHMNTVISEYNQTPNATTLSQLYHLHLNMEAKYPGDVITGIAQFQTEIHEKLFNALQLHMPPPEAFLDAQRAMADVINRMSPNKVSEFLHLLSTCDKTEALDINQLYPDSDNSAEAIRFRQAFPPEDTQTIFLGGNNARNFIITTIEPLTGVKTEVVLKVDNRFGIPKDVEMLLRAQEQLAHTFAPVYAEHQATFMNLQNKKTTCSLVMTKLSPAGDLESYLSKPANFSNDDMLRLKSALDIYQQMANILMQFEANDCAFPDMKNANWLIDVDSQNIVTLKLADTKSFIRTQEHMINWKETQAAGHREKLEIMTIDYSPVEAMNDKPFSADKMHTFMLGANLLQYLIGTGIVNGERPSLENILDLSEEDFSADIFKTETGIELKVLITAMLKEKPEKRPTLEEVTARLEAIQSKFLAKTSGATITPARAIQQSRSAKEILTDMKSAENSIKNIDSPTLRKGT